MSSSLYVHIPYCKSICTYCDFCKMLYQESQVYAYLDALEKELKKVYRNEPLKTIYIGGGTPSCLSIDELTRLFEILETVQKKDNIEYTIECNFDTIDKDKLDLFKRVGINRISFGIETIHKKLELFLGRNNNKNHIKKMIQYAKSIGIVNINVDLMYALKDETLNDLETDIDFILSLDVPHISTYSLIIEKNTCLYIQKEIPIDSDMDALMYEKICKKLRKCGYLHYEISNFAKPGYESRHNINYWQNLSYYGIGLGAASYYDGKRMTNTRSITKYLKKNVILTCEHLSKMDTMIYEVILRLRLATGINLEEFYEKYNVSIDEVFCYQSLIEKNLLKLNGKYLIIPEEKFYISNYIIEEFIYGKK